MRSLAKRAYNQYQTGGITYLSNKSIDYLTSIGLDLWKDQYPAEIVLSSYQKGFRPATYCWLGLQEGRDSEAYIATPDPIRRVNHGYSSVIDNKYSFARYTGAYSDALPELHGTVENGQFRSLSEADQVSIRSLVKAGDRIVLKPMQANHGDGFYILHQNNDTVTLENRERTVKSVNSVINKLDGYLVMEYIDQDEYSNDIYPKSANTIRLLTMIDPDTLDPCVIRAAHRFGSAASAPTDNWSAGGYCAPIDVETGTLGSIITLKNGHQRVELETHPETGTPVHGTAVPYWQACLDLVKTLANLHRPARCIGWDLIVTDSGPIVIEANAGTGIHLIQATEGLLADPIARRLLG